MKLRMVSFFALALLVAIRAVAAADTYTADDFVNVPKFDSHVHANTEDHVFLDIAKKDGFELLSINVDYPDFPTLATQANVAHGHLRDDPKRFHYLTTFSMKGFEKPTWTADNIRRIDAEITQGAVGVKVWKNVGMVEKDAHGRLIMLDDPRFDGRLQRARPPERPQKKIERDRDFIDVANVLRILTSVEFHNHAVASRVTEFEMQVQVEGLLVTAATYGPASLGDLS